VLLALRGIRLDGTKAAEAGNPPSPQPGAAKSRTADDG
jgi:hypothetical protein